MDGPQERHAEEGGHHPKCHMCDPICMKHPEQAKPRRQKLNKLEGPGAEGRRGGGACMDAELAFGKTRPFGSRSRGQSHSNVNAPVLLNVRWKW